MLTGWDIDVLLEDTEWLGFDGKSVFVVHEPSTKTGVIPL